MALVSFTTAASMAGVSRVTMTKHIKTGKISTVTDQEGRRKVDTSELLRVYGALTSDTAKINVKRDVKGRVLSANPLQAENDALRAETRLLRELLAERAEVVHALKGQIALIEHKTQDNKPDQDAVMQKYLRFEELLKLKYAENGREAL
jgi:hypothetical protein